MRIVALSATMPNLDDIGDWLECGENGVHFFDDTFRPVPLEVKVESYGQARNPFLFEKILDGRVRSVISRYSEGKQTLIFCASKKGAENLCDILLRETYSASRNANTQEVNNLINSLQDIHLKALVQRGYGYHHGGLPPDDRVIVESLFLGGYIDVLCSTSTLAHGVNLPAHLVIIKGTNSWRGGSRGYERTSRSDVIQMIGRAGRPDFDSTGIAVIMTSDQDKFYYQNLSTSADVVESTMQHILVEGNRYMLLYFAFF